MVKIFGRRTPLELSFMQVEKEVSDLAITKEKKTVRAAGQER
jgi:hypothetical protein